MPRRRARDDVERTLEQHADWIARRRPAWPRAPPRARPAGHRLAGRRPARRRGAGPGQRARRAVRRRPPRRGPTAEARARALERWCRAAAAARLAALTAFEAERLGTRPRRVQVRAQRTRFGSYTPTTGTLTLNWRLMVAPLEVQRYVVVHELCHISRADPRARSGRSSSRPCRASRTSGAGSACTAPRSSPTLPAPPRAPDDRRQRPAAAIRASASSRSACSFGSTAAESTRRCRRRTRSRARRWTARPCGLGESNARRPSPSSSSRSRSRVLQGLRPGGDGRSRHVERARGRRRRKRTGHGEPVEEAERTGCQTERLELFALGEGERACGGGEQSGQRANVMGLRLETVHAPN